MFRQIPTITRPTLGTTNYNNRYSLVLPTATQPGIYVIEKDKKENKYRLVHTLDKYKTPEVIYGKINYYIDYYWKGFIRNQFQCSLMLTGIKGAGKALQKDTPVLTPTGWVPINKLQVGDIVIGKDGNPTKVTGVYPQGVKKLYEVTLLDNRKTTVCLEHLWSIYLNNDNTSIVTNTKDIINKMKKHNVYIDLPDSKQPYHGTIDHTYLDELIAGKDSVEFVIGDNELDETLEYLRSLGGIPMVITSELHLNYVHYTTNRYNQGKIRIKDISYKTEDEAICISVDNEDKLFVVNDYIVTHNTEVSKVLCNKCLTQGMKVVSIANIRYTPELIQFLEELDDVVFFFDEFSKVFPYNTQDKMLTLLSNTNNRRRIVIITENNLNTINEHIRNRPGRVRYSKHFNKLDISVVKEYCEAMNVSKKFFKDLLTTYNKSLTFAFDHLQALVTEHLALPDVPFDDIIDVLNMDEFVDTKYIVLKDIAIDKDIDKFKDLVINMDKTKFENNITLDMFTNGIPIRLSVIGKKEEEQHDRHITTIILTKNELDKLYEDELTFKLEGITITAILSEDVKPTLNNNVFGGF